MPTEQDKLSTQKFVLRGILIRYCGMVLTADTVLRITDELIHEIKDGSCSWAFASKDV